MTDKPTLHKIKGLMALLAGQEKALVEVRYALSLHSADAKNTCLRMAEEALTGGFADFQRSGGLVPFNRDEGARHE
jgi:hypothetical protein